MAGGFTNTVPDSLDILEEDAGVRRAVGSILERSPLLVFVALSVVALLLIMGVSALVGSLKGEESAVPDLPVRMTQELLFRQVQTTMQLAEERTFLQALHPLLTLEEIMQGDTLPRDFLAEEMLRLKQIRLALSVDIRSTLRNSVDKPAAFDTLLANLIGIDQRGVIAYSRLADQSNVLAEQLAALDAQEAAAQATLDASFASESGDIAHSALNTLVTARERRAQLAVRAELVDDLFAAYPDELGALRARIAGARANREILIRDLYAVDIDAAGIELIREGRADAYYRATPLPESALPPRFDGLVTGDAGRLSTLPVANNILDPLEEPVTEYGNSGGSGSGSGSGLDALFGSNARSGTPSGGTTIGFGAGSAGNSGSGSAFSAGGGSAEPMLPYGWDGTLGGFFTPQLVDGGPGSVPRISLSR